MKNSVLIENLTTDELSNLIGNVMKTKLDEFRASQPVEPEQEGLMTRKEVLELLKINPSTLWSWQNRGRIRAYKVNSKCYYKREEVMKAMTPVKSKK